MEEALMTFKPEKLQKIQATVSLSSLEERTEEIAFRVLLRSGINLGKERDFKEAVTLAWRQRPGDKGRHSWGFDVAMRNKKYETHIDAIWAALEESYPLAQQEYVAKAALLVDAVRRDELRFFGIPRKSKKLKEWKGLI
jgi:hypothetical protein